MKLGRIAAIGILAVFPLSGGLFAQQEQPDMWGMWRSGFEKFEAAEKAAKSRSGEVEAAKLYSEAREIFLRIRSINSSWNSEVISYRLNLCDRRILALKAAPAPRAGASLPAAPSAPAAAVPARTAVRTGTASARETGSREIESLRKQLAQSRLELIDARRAVENAQAKSAPDQEQIRRLLAEKNELVRANAALKARLDDADSKLAARRRSEEKEAEARLLAEKTRSVQLQRQLNSVKLNLETAEMNYHESTERRAELELKLKKLNAELDKAVAAAASASKFYSDNQTLKEHNASLEKTVGSLNAKIADLDAKNNRLTADLAAVSSGKVQTAASKQLADKLEQERRGREEASDRAEKLSGELSALKKEADRQKTERSERVIELVKHLETINRLTKEKDDLMTRLAEMQKLEQANADLKKECGLLRKNLADYSVQFEALKKSASESDSNLAALLQARETMKKLESERDAVRKELALARSAKPAVVSDPAKDAEIRTLRERAEKLESELKTIRAAAAEAATSAAAGHLNVEKSLAVLRGELESARSENGTLKTSIASLKAENRKLSASLAGMVPAADLNRRTDEYAALEKKFKDSQAAAEQRNSEHASALKAADAKAADLQQRLDAFHKNAETQARNEIAKLTASVHEVSEARAKLETALRKVTEERTALQQENLQLREGLASGKQEIAMLNDKLARPTVDQQKLRDAEAKAETLEKQSAEAESKLKALEAKTADSVAALDKAAAELAAEKKASLRYRTEIEQWIGNPVREDEKIIKQKDEAIDVLVKEGADLRRENTVLKTELTMARDEVSRVKALSLSVAKNLQRARAEAAELRAGKVPAAALPAPVKPGSDPVLRALAADSAAAESPAKKAERAKQFAEAMKLARDAEGSGDISGALMNYWRAVDADPMAADAHLGLARVYLRRSDKPSAAKAYAKAIDCGAVRDHDFELRLK